MLLYVLYFIVIVSLGHVMNTCQNLSWEWQRQIWMIRYKNYNFNVNENFVFDLQVNFVLHIWFHYWNEIPINCLFTNWKYTYVLDFRPWRWSAFNMGFVVKRPSRMQGQFFLKLGGVDNMFWSGSKKSLKGHPIRIWHLQSLWGGVQCPPNLIS